MTVKMVIEYGYSKAEITGDSLQEITGDALEAFKLQVRMANLVDEHGSHDKIIQRADRVRRELSEAS